jgi:hypothetical protein
MSREAAVSPESDVRKLEKEMRTDQSENAEKSGNIRLVDEKDRTKRS